MVFTNKGCIRDFNNGACADSVYETKCHKVDGRARHHGNNKRDAGLTVMNRIGSDAKDLSYNMPVAGFRIMPSSGAHTTDFGYNKLGAGCMPIFGGCDKNLNYIMLAAGFIVVPIIDCRGNLRFVCCGTSASGRCRSSLNGCKP